MSQSQFIDAAYKLRAAAKLALDGCYQRSRTADALREAIAEYDRICDQEAVRVLGLADTLRERGAL